MQVIDLGSGKGYLSEHLALDHGLLVLGIDSTDTNSQSTHVHVHVSHPTMCRCEQAQHDGAEDVAAAAGRTRHGAAVLSVLPARDCDRRLRDL